MLAATCKSVFSGTAVNLQKHCIRDVMTALPFGGGVSYFTFSYFVLCCGQTIWLSITVKLTVPGCIFSQILKSKTRSTCATPNDNSHPLISLLFGTSSFWIDLYVIVLTDVVQPCELRAVSGQHIFTQCGSFFTAIWNRATYFNTSDHNLTTNMSVELKTAANLSALFCSVVFNGS